MPIYANAPADTLTTSPVLLKDLAVVAIGRNEGLRLKRCLESIAGRAAIVVYVDSGSTDDSLAIAEHLGAVIVVLDTDVPFTAARARNAGYREALRLLPDLNWIQFVDGDCEVRSAWLEQARQFLAANHSVAVVCGRRRERFPERSIYNELCDLEWDTEPGPAMACGGDAMIRAEALLQVDGYRDSLIAGEEPELCVRLRAEGWQIHRLNEEMTLHDANMMRFSQWWKRMKRSGWAYAAGAHLHGKLPERYWVWQCLQAWIWVALPLALIVSCFFIIGAWALLILCIYPIQMIRLYLRIGGTKKHRFLCALAFTIGRFPEFAGQIRYLLDLLRNRTSVLIEYK